MVGIASYNSGAVNKYDLSINRYKKVEHEEVVYEAPQVIIARLEALEREIAGELAVLALRLTSTSLSTGRSGTD